MKILQRVAVLAALALGSVLQAQAATNVIYFDPFTAGAGSALNGSTPKDHGGVGVEAWIAPEDGFTMDGSALLVTAGSRWSALPFIPEEGNKYKISMDMNPTHTGADWFAIGFAETPAPTSDYPAQRLTGWLLTRGLNPGYPLHSFTGYATDGGGQAGNYTGLHNISVILDTTLANWTFEYFVDDVSQRGPVAFSATADVNPSILYVTFGSYGSARGGMDNFKLENIFHVVNGPPTIATQPQDATVVLGGTAKFTVLAAGPKPISYQWYKNNQELAGETGFTLTVANLTAADSGAKFTAKVTNSLGTTTTTAATLTVLNVAGPLIHKFNFVDGTVNDAVGGMTGVIKGTTKITAGQLAFDGSDGGFGLLSPYPMPPAGSATVVAWFRASSTLGQSARVFDFGSGTLNYLYFTPMAGNGGPARFGFKAGDDAEANVSYTQPLRDDLEHMVAAVIDSTPTDTGANGTMLLYIDGKEAGSTPLNGTTTLANLDSGPQNYIGKSQWVNTGDLPFKGFIDEVRVYNTALSQSAIAALVPDANPASAPVIDLQPKNTPAVLGGSVSLLVGVTGSKPMTFQWRLDGKNISTSTTSVLTLANVKTNDFGAYSVVIANSSGSVTSSVAQVYLNRWSYEAWNDDATSGVDTNFFYSHAYNFGSSVGTTINGLVFTGVPGGNPSVANSFTVTGIGNVYNNDANNLPEGEGSRTLANDFIYGGNPGTFKLFGLTPGRDYLLTFFSVGWEGPGNRWVTFSAAGGQSLLVDQDTFDNNGGIRISYQYTADADGSVSITNTPSVAGNTHHSYGFCNRLLNKLGSGIAPEIKTQPESTTAALGSTGGFSVVALGSAPLIYQWKFNGANIAGATSSACTVENVQASNFGNYSVVVRNDWGSVTSVVATLSLLRISYTNWLDDATSGVDTGYLYTHAYNFGAAANADINGLVFTGLAGGNPSVPGVFAVNGSGNVFNNDANNLPDGTGSRTLANDFIYGGAPGSLTLYGLTPGRKYLLTLFSVAFEGSGARKIQFSAADSQRVIVDQDSFEDNNGILVNYEYTADSSGSVSLTNNSVVSGATFHFYGFCNRFLDKQAANAAPEVLRQPQSGAMALNGQSTFTVAGGSPTPITYQWRFNGTDIAGATTDTYTIPSVQAANFGDYTVVLRNTYGAVTSVVARLSILRWSYEAWKDDASSGVDTKYVYTHAYNFGTTVGATVNGLAFTGIAGGNPSVSNSFSLTGVGSVYNSDANTITGTSRILATDFLYGGNPGILTLKGLTPGKEYLLTLFSVGWDDSGRTIRFSAADHQITVFDQDSYGNNNGIRISYQYVAGSDGTVSISTAQVGIGTFHTYAFCNRELQVGSTTALSVTRGTGGAITLSWPETATGYTLKASPALGAAANWQTVATAPAINNGKYEVSVPAGSGTQFFQLQK